MTKENLDTVNKLLIPSTWIDDKSHAILEDLNKVTPEDIETIGVDLDAAKDHEEKWQQEQEQKKWNLNPEKMTPELPEYTRQLKENFLNLQWIDKDKLVKIDKFVSEMESKWYIKRCTYEWGVMVMIDIPWYKPFKYFEPNFEKHSIWWSYLWKFGPYCVTNIRDFWWEKLDKSETKYGGTWILPLRKNSDERYNFALYHYIKDTMEENNFSFVSFHHDRKFLKILWEYYRKCTWDTTISTKELIAMRSRVLLSWWYWLQKDEWWFKSWVIECYDNHCGFNLMFWPDEFDYISFLLTDLELTPQDFLNWYNTNNL